MNTVREKYSSFWKKLNQENKDLKIHLTNNQECYYQLTQEFSVIKAENIQLKEQNTQLNKEVLQGNCQTIDIEDYK